MLVKCTELDPRRFNVSEDDKAFYLGQFGKGHASKTYTHLELERSYLVYAVVIVDTRPSFFVTDCSLPQKWRLTPNACFEVQDARVSRYWHYSYEQRQLDGRVSALTQFAIKPWIEEPMFAERLIDFSPREVEIFSKAVAEMDAEFCL